MYKKRLNKQTIEPLYMQGPNPLGPQNNVKFDSQPSEPATILVLFSFTKNKVKQKSWKNQQNQLN
jgi:hypothetical protein